MEIRENKGKDNILLSICIPTYNRADKVVNLVKSILLYKGNGVEIIVLDNCSTDNTKLLLQEIEDTRLIYKNNEENIGGVPNILKVLTYGSGEFKMLCLDKDSIVFENLTNLIKRITDDSEIVVGQCKLNIEIFGLDLIYNPGLPSLYNLAYTSEHPSGLFFKSSVLINSGIIDKINKINKNFAFNTELLKAEMALLGKSIRINIPIIQTERLEVCEKETSHTYKGENIYFYPKNIIKTFDIYIKHLYGLNLPKEHKNIVTGKIFSSLLISSTLDFKSIMENKSICMHHSINTRKISFWELIKIYISFSIAFIKSDIPINIFYKIYIYIIAQIKMIFVFASNKFKNSARRNKIA